ncbi:Type II restriction-modification system restriction subunit [Lachnospiraceae bacterium TWA4]|nr:Type II restriction-modification system restriction subunit [Lachnospiraceae bacterium TWA4]
MTWSGCVAEDNSGKITLISDSLTESDKADLFDILTYEDFWIPKGNNFNEIKLSYQTYMDIEEQKIDNKKESSISFSTGFQSLFSRNRILFGAPGTGKSFTLNKDAKTLIGENNEDDYERVTFHPDYSYANFVGTYKPVPIIDKDGNDAITYEYVPGPFMRIYVKALKNSRTNNVKPFLLIIEEINRANVAAVFGDIFNYLIEMKIL